MRTFDAFTKHLTGFLGCWELFLDNCESTIEYKWKHIRIGCGGNGNGCGDNDKVTLPFGRVEVIDECDDVIPCVLIVQQGEQIRC